MVPSVPMVGRSFIGLTPRESVSPYAVTAHQKTVPRNRQCTALPHVGAAGSVNLMRRVPAAIAALALIPLAACGGSTTNDKQSYRIDQPITGLVVDARAAAVVI